VESQENQGRMADKPSGIQGMKRRTFIKATGAFGLSTALPWGNVYGQERKSAEFLRKRSSVSARWGDEAGLSFSKCAHIAYDWLYPALDDNQRKKVFDMWRVMAFYDAKEKFDVKLQHTNGWFGATATGDFGQVECWIRTDECAARPASFASKIINRQINLWGRSGDGEIFYI